MNVIFKKTYCRILVIRQNHLIRSFWQKLTKYSTQPSSASLNENKIVNQNFLQLALQKCKLFRKQNKLHNEKYAANNFQNKKKMVIEYFI